MRQKINSQSEKVVKKVVVDAPEAEQLRSALRNLIMENNRMINTVKKKAVGASRVNSEGIRQMDK